jgi:hypothetical protein
MITRREALALLGKIAAAVTLADASGLLGVKAAKSECPSVVWAEWNRIDITANAKSLLFYINGKDVTAWPEIVRKIALVYQIQGNGDLRFGGHNFGLTLAANDQAFRWVRFHIRVRQFPANWDLDEVTVG